MQPTSSAKHEICHVYFYMQVFEQVMVEFEGASEKDIALAVLWRTCAIVGGVYLFYLFEMVLHKLTSHSTTQPVREGGGRGGWREGWLEWH